MKTFKLISAIILTLLAVIFILQNTEIVNVTFLVWEIALSRSLLVFLLVLIGVLIGWFSHAIYRHSRKK